MIRKLLLLITILFVTIQNATSSIDNLVGAIFYCFSNSNSNKSEIIIDVILNLLAFLPIILSNIILSIGVLIISQKRIKDKLFYVLITLSYGWLGFILLLLNLSLKKVVFNEKLLKELMLIMVIALLSSYFGALIGIYTYDLIDGHNLDYVDLSNSTKSTIKIVFSMTVHLLTVGWISSLFNNYLKKENNKRLFWILITLISGVIPWIIFNITILSKRK